MKLLFMGDLQFGRKGKICDLELPNNILKLFNSSDVLFFNLETVVLNTHFDIDKHKLNHKQITYCRLYFFFLIFTRISQFIVIDFFFYHSTIICSS